MPLSAGSTIDGRYALERVLGRGATATVWLARDEVTGSEVALKVLLPELADSSVRRSFTREIRYTTEFEHPRILPALGSGEVEDTLYIVLPYMAEGTLRQRLDREGQLPLTDVLTIGASLADALAYAHTRKLVHRDVKPENILFSGGVAHLSDFGICQALERSLEESSTYRAIVRGTPAYMSPEQASGASDYDGRSDIFSLGSVLYECLAGVKAFIGGTHESVMAQVISHPPRDLRIYRPTVPDALVEILASCHEKRPADRFRDAGSLAIALATSERRSGRGSGAVRPIEPGVSGESKAVSLDKRANGGRLTPVPDPRRFTGRHLALLAVAVTATLGVIERSRLSTALFGPPSDTRLPADTTHLLLFPLERIGFGAGDQSLDDDLLRAGFNRGRGFTLRDQIQIDDALRRRPRVESSADADAVARELRAGRYVRGRLRLRGDSLHAYLGLYDVGSAAALYSMDFAVPRAFEAAGTRYARAAAELLARGDALGSDTGAVRAAWSAPALQAYASAQRSLSEWDLAAADSLFERAVSYDATDARAMLALAQVRAWRRRPASTWSAVAARAAAAGGALPERDRQLAIALTMLGERRYAEACAGYESLRRRNDRDFAAWYGLGQCRSMDNVVVRDSIASPSGWRFRSSRHAAIRAYTEAFKLLPTVHRAFGRDGFDGLRALFLVSTDVRPGISESDGARFLARPSWRGDSLALIPLPMDVVSTGGPSAVPEGFAEALRRQAMAFHEIALGWSAAFPRSSEAKEAVSIALELLGNPAALDTIRAARALASDVERQRTLGAAEVRLLVRFGTPDDVAALRTARRLADSLLATAGAPSRQESQELELLAILRGRCADAIRHGTRAVAFTEESGVSDVLLAEARTLLDRVAMQCDPDRDAPAIRAFTGRIEDEQQANKDPNRRMLDMMLLYRQVLMASNRDSALSERIAQSTALPLATAARAIARGDRGAARDALEAFDRSGHVAIPITPDLAFIAARLWADAGDEARAIELLDRALERLRYVDPNALREPGAVAGLMRAMQLRGSLAESAGDRGTARRWRAAVAALQDK